MLESGLGETPRYRGSTPEAVADLRRWVQDGWRVVVVTEGHGLAKRVNEVLSGEEVPSRLDADLADLAPGMVHLTTGSLGAGFLAPRSQLAVVTETDLTGTPGQGGSTKDMRRMPSRRRNQVDPLQLNPGDFVVHEQHGVGKFVEMVQRTVGGATREYLVLEYAAVQARPARRPPLRADRPARPGHPLRRRRAAHPQQDGRLRLAQDQDEGRAATSSRSPTS